MKIKFKQMKWYDECTQKEPLRLVRESERSGPNQYQIDRDND